MSAETPPYFTASGDDGTTGMLGGGRVSKFDLRIETIGALDEANAALGLARSLCQTEAVREAILAVQRDLYRLMAETSAGADTEKYSQSISAETVQRLEAEVERIGSQVQMPNEFILPGDTPSAAALDLARTVVRRAERWMAQLLASGGSQNRFLLSYLNRLSSLCFVLELYEVRHGGRQDPTLAKNQT